MTSPKRIYLDYNATSPLRPSARAAIISALDTLGNPSSVHTEGRRARHIIETAREQVAALVGTKPTNVVFTSGATEANNWVLSAGWHKLLIPAIEHASVIDAPAHSSASIIKLSSDTNGIIQPADLKKAIVSSSGKAQTSCLSLQMANNETGILQKVADVAAICREHDIAVHTDAVQAAGRVAIDFQRLGADMLSLSSHKIGGPMGVGALILRDSFELPSLITGGGQERYRRAGTENISGIAGFGAAAACALRELANIDQCRMMRDDLEHNIKSITPEAVIIGEKADRLANTSCIALPEMSAETLLIKLDLAGIAVSSGAACSSGKVGVSHVLSSMGVSHKLARGAIRISLGWNSSATDISTFISTWRHIVGPDQYAVA